MSLFEGSGTAIVTPFTETGVDYDGLAKNIEFQIQNKTDAIIVCGTTGEASTMPDDEHKAVIKYVVEAVRGRIPVIAGTGSNDTIHAIDLSKYAQSAGADALLVVTPYYNKTSPKGLIKHFKAIAKTVDIPIMIYNVPSRTNINVTPAILKELCAVDNITAVKEASGNLGQIAQIMQQCGDKIDVYSGDDNITLPVLSLGGKGVVSVASNIIPRDVHDMTEKFFNHDLKGSRELQINMLNLINALFIEVNPIPIKTAMNLLGHSAGLLRMPLCEMEEANLQVLKQQLKEYGLCK